MLSTQSMRQIAASKSKELAEFIYSDEQFVEMLMNLTSKFMETQMPEMDEDLTFEIGLMMFESLRLSA